MSEKAYHTLFTICWEWDFTKSQDHTLGEIIRIFYPNMGWALFGPWNNPTDIYNSKNPQCLTLLT